MNNNKRELIYRKKIRVSNDATLKVRAYDSKRKNFEGAPIYETYGTVVYDDGEAIELEPVVSSENGYFLSNNGLIYRCYGYYDFDENVFDVKNRENIILYPEYEERQDLVWNKTTDDMSIPFYRIVDLKNGNKMLVNRYWSENEDLIDAYFFLNKKGNTSYLSYCVASSKDDEQAKSFAAFDEENIYFYIVNNDEERSIDVIETFDINSGKTKEETKSVEKVKGLIR